MRRYRVALAFIAAVMLAAVLAPSSAFAQNGASKGRFVSGPLVWTPILQLREAGVDSNVFNTPTDPKQDMSGGAVGQLNSVLTLGLLQASTQGAVEYTHFQRYTHESGLNGRVNTRLAFPLTRVSPDVAVAWDHVKERSGNEIDTRAPRTDLGYSLGLQTRLTSRVTLAANGGRQKSNYEQGFTFRGVAIAEQLNHTLTQATVTGRVTVTPFTVFATNVSYGRDEFPARPDSATDNMRADAGFDFAPDAVIHGHASVGYHRMQPQKRNVSSAVAGDFAGLTSAIDLGYTLLGVTRFNGRFGRDSSYSISTDQPIYVSTIGGIDVLQSLFGPVNLNVHASRERMAYAANEFAPERTDFANLYGGGLSIQAGAQMVVALIYDQSERRSSGGRQFEYDRRRIYTTVTYGF
jgi:hypothetical protein